MAIHKICKSCGLPKIPNRYVRCRECHIEMHRQPGEDYPDEKHDIMYQFDTCRKIEKNWIQNLMNSAREKGEMEYEKS